MTRNIKNHCVFTLLLFFCIASKAQYINPEFRGKKQLQNPEYIFQINKNCLYSTANETEIDIKNCPFHQLGYIDNDSDDVLFPMGEKVYIAELENGDKLFIVRGRDFVSRGYFARLDLYIESKGGFIPSKILIYGMTEHGSSDRHKELYYYLEEDFLYLVEFEVGEEGYKGDFWKKYKINFNNGSFDLIESITCEDKKDATGEVIYTRQESTIRECKVDKVNG